MIYLEDDLLGSSPIGRVSLKVTCPATKSSCSGIPDDTFFEPSSDYCVHRFFKQNLCPFQKLRLWFILITFLKFRKFQPRHFYKISSYKKGVSFFTVMKTTPLQLTVTNSMIWGTLPLKDPGIGIGTVSPS